MPKVTVNYPEPVPAPEPTLTLEVTPTEAAALHVLLGTVLAADVTSDLWSELHAHRQAFNSTRFRLHDANGDPIPTIRFAKVVR